MVGPGAREGVVGEGQGGQGGLHGVAQGAGAAVPGEPGAELAEVLERRQGGVSEGSGRGQGGVREVTLQLVLRGGVRGS